MNSIKKKTNESAKTMETVKTNVEQFIGQLNLIHDMKELNVYAPKSTLNIKIHEASDGTDTR